MWDGKSAKFADQRRVYHTANGFTAVNVPCELCSGTADHDRPQRLCQRCTTADKP